MQALLSDLGHQSWRYMPEIVGKFETFTGPMFLINSYIPDD